MNITQSTTHDGFLAACEPYFLDGVHTVAQFAQRTQKAVRRAVELRKGPLVKALGLKADEVTLLDYWSPDKIQKAKPTEEIGLGVKLKVSDWFESAIYRYWKIQEKDTGIEAFTWLKPRTQLDEFVKKMDNLPDEPPGREDAWEFWKSNIGTYFITRSLNESEVSELAARLDEMITYYLNLMVKIGGVKQFHK